ncbi:hypothetical protein GUJ93_ZPchr0001g30147 [Zizania palustris]|uniref:Uncharacterized protein n=1 Tax=Zizania palustris TaxID=103762 RepID=A0A8J5SEF4_ZIZPA|nr:hypothetical protein GUJ93_ZPchr0001g32096 [Zizania palustris]KAG8053784.1 hypothetical protein GUJ93_ZPchr0001g30147 [Zizania palustris]
MLASDDVELRHFTEHVPCTGLALLWFHCLPASNQMERSATSNVYRFQQPDEHAAVARGNTRPARWRMHAAGDSRVRRVVGCPFEKYDQWKEEF